MLCVHLIDRHFCILVQNSLGRRVTLPAQRGEALIGYRWDQGPELVSNANRDHRWTFGLKRVGECLFDFIHGIGGDAGAAEGLGGSDDVESR
jgi:hypothetical protein